MSADNGVYILETPTADGGLEYRVSHIQAVENMDWDRCPIHGRDIHRGNDGRRRCPECVAHNRVTDDHNVIIQNAREMWRGKVYTDKAAALLAASEVLEKLYICEYGISFIRVNAQF